LIFSKSSREILSAMREANKRIEAKKSAGNVIVSLKTVYDRYIKPNEFFPNEDTYYYNMVAPICNMRTYPEMYQREIDKRDRGLRCMDADMGVRCYTMHSSKGHEAKHIYMLDVNEGIFPNIKKLEEKSRMDCEYDASLDVRAERNLLYVAITRAKDSVTISYSDNSLCSLISTPESNIYSHYDKIYRNEHKLYDDLKVFERLICVV
jgi:superfamily I DNA/RNA helicase